MKRLRFRFRPYALCVLVMPALLVLLLCVAASAQQSEGTGQAAGHAGQQTTAAQGPSGSQEAKTVQVALDEFVIRMPHALPAGATAFHIKNTGSLEHNFEIRREGSGQGLDRKVSKEAFGPGKTRSMRIDLKPGRYYIWCPVGSHEARGMKLNLTVQSEGGAAEAGAAAGAGGAAQTAGQGAGGTTGEPTAAGAGHQQTEAAEHGQEEGKEAGEHVGDGHRPADLRQAGGWKQFVYWLGNFHPPMVNFPIALIVVAGLGEFFAALTGREALNGPVRFCVWVGGCAAIVAAALGWCFAGFRLHDADWMLMTHRWMGTTTAVLSFFLLILNELWRPRPSRGLRTLFRWWLLLTTCMVVATGFFGGAMLYGMNHYAWPPHP